MKQENQPLRFGPDDLDDEDKALQALLSYDKQPTPTLEALRRDPHRAQALDRLESADRWLRDQALAAGATSACPTAEELYSFGAGPGAEQWSAPLATERRAAIDKHLAVCVPCESFVATLQVAPPSPLVFDKGADEPVEDVVGTTVPPRPASPPSASRPTGRILRPARWLVAAVAASIVVLLGVRLGLRESTAAGDPGSWVDPLRGGTTSGEASTNLLPGEMLLVIDEKSQLADPELVAVSAEVNSRPEALYKFTFHEYADGGLKASMRELFASEPKASPSHGLDPAWLRKPAELRLECTISQGLVRSSASKVVTVVEDPKLLAAVLDEKDREKRAELLHKRGFHAQAVAQLRAERTRLEGLIKELRQR
jgi:hypothetical protein